MKPIATSAMEFIRRLFQSLFFGFFQNLLFQVGFIKHGETDVSQPGASDFLILCKGTIAKLDELVKRFKRQQGLSEESDYQLLNEHQCLWLVRRLLLTRETVLAEIQQPALDEKSSQVLRELHHVLLDVDRLIHSCCIKSTASDLEWLRKIIEHGDLEETFSKLFYDVKWLAHVLQRIVDPVFEDSSSFTEADCTGDLSVENREDLQFAKKKDDKILISRLESLKLDDPLEQELADQLLEKMRVPADKHEKSSVSVGHLLLLDPEKLKKHLKGNKLGSGSFGEVRETNVLGGSFAMKFFVKNSEFEKEKDAIQGLGHHPHVVRLYCYSKIVDRCYLIMEKMDEDLDKFLQGRQHDSYGLSPVEKVVLMLEIAEGIRYIHSKRMAHRDLKPGNVLVNLEDPSNSSSRACSVKIADFGLTKTKNASRTYKDMTTNTGTGRYMAPEVIAFQSKGRPAKTEANARKADAYSFGIMCYEILTGKAFGDEYSLVELKKQVKESQFRPDLQKESGPLSLKSLIRQCWDNNFRSRPDFKEICQVLRYIKGLLLRDDQQTLETDIKFTSIEAPDPVMQQAPDPVMQQVPDPVMQQVLEPVMQGPWGRNEPNKTVGQFNHKAASIRWIRVRYQQNPPGIGLLEVGYVNVDGQEHLERYCTDTIGIAYTKIEFKPKEYIKQISGCVATHPVTVGNGGTAHLYCVVSLTIHTNFKSYGPFGDETTVSGKRFRSGTGRVVGFFGDGVVLLDKLGVWIIPDGQEDGDPSYLVEQF